MRETAHSVQLAVTILIMCGIAWYVHSHMAHREEEATGHDGRYQEGYGWCHINGPLLLTCISIPLILADPMRHFLQDQGVWLSCSRVPGQTFPDSCLYSSDQYRCKVMCCHQQSKFNCVDLGICTAKEYDGTSDCGCGCIPTTQERFWNLSPMGIVFTLVFTYLGFTLLLVGTMWNANLCDKIDDICEEWAELRGTNRVVA